MEQTGRNEEFTVELQGGSPWGFALQGGLDHRSPLRIGKVTPGGRAASSGLVAGDYILQINGQATKDLKHLQAQQLIKRSRSSVQLLCTKVRPGGLMSPAVIGAAPASFSFPVANGNKTPPTKVKANSVLHPKPPPGPSQVGGVANGHRRYGSQDTASESTSNSISSPSSLASPCNIGPSPSLASPSNTATEVEVYDVKFLGMSEAASGCGRNSPPATPTNDAVQGSAPDETQVDQSNGSATKETGEVEKQEEELIKEVENISTVVEDIQKEVEDLKEVVATEEETSGSGLEGSSDVFTKSTSDASEGGPTTGAEEERGRRRSQRNSFSKRELADAINLAAQTRARRESSADLSSSIQSDEGQTVSEPHPPPQQETLPTISTPAAAAQSSPPQHHQEEVPVIKPTLKKRDSAPTLTKDPGWYQQMFQSFTTTVQEAFPGAKAPCSTQDEATPTYSYDERGLKVRSGSVSKVPEIKAERKQSQSPEPPVYVYDDRGLRVQVGKHVRGKSTPAIMTPEVEPATKFSASDGAIKDNIMASNKKTTFIRTKQYSTDNSRDYWKQKDKEHIQFDEQRRRFSEDLTAQRHSRSASVDHTTSQSEKMTHMHPLLRQEVEESDTKPGPSEDQNGKVFDRIDASKLQGALANASVLSSLEQEGVPSHLLPAIAKTQQEASAAAAREEEKKKAPKPPPGPKAQASYNFQGKNSKELSFSKGDFLDLTQTIDENWLEGQINDRVGIFPANYVKVLTQTQYEELVAPKPPTPVIKALALFDFEGQTHRELGFQKGDVITIDKKVDDNWYRGQIGDKKGIFPVAYVKIIEE